MRMDGSDARDIDETAGRSHASEPGARGAARRGFVAMTSESRMPSRARYGKRQDGPPPTSARKAGGAHLRLGFQDPVSLFSSRLAPRRAPRTARDPPPTYLPVVTFSPRLKSRYEAARRWLSPPDRVYRSGGSSERLLESICASLTTITTSSRDDLVNGEHPPMHVQTPPTDK